MNSAEIKKSSSLGGKVPFPTSSSEFIECELDLQRDTFRHASRLVDLELDALDTLNKRKAVVEIAETLNINPHELFLYIEYGEEECERIFNLMRADRPPPRPDPVKFEDVRNVGLSNGFSATNETTE